MREFLDAIYTYPWTALYASFLVAGVLHSLIKVHIGDNITTEENE